MIESMKRFFGGMLAFGLCLSSGAQGKPIPVKVVVVTAFEVGADTGDAPGELQFWVERDHLDKSYDVAGAGHAVWMNDAGEMAVLTGEGPAHAAATMMAVGLDPRFDFSHAYWIVAGIAGANPGRASLGSAVWARWVVDGDMCYQLDGRDIPAGWTTGTIPLGKSSPYEQPVNAQEGQVFALNAGLAEWAFERTRGTRLMDSAEMHAAEKDDEGAAAQKAPFVLLGDELASARYWHGARMEAWAREWVRYFTDGKGEYATSAMEDAGTLTALKRLGDAGRVDWRRVMVLRTVSNYDREARGQTAAESLQHQRASKSPAFLPAVENAYRVGGSVAGEILRHWGKYEQGIPGTK